MRIPASGEQLRQPLLLLCFMLWMAVFAAAPRVQAALGETADSVEADGRALSGVRRVVTAHSRYTVHEVYSDSTVVREYVSPSGIVFGIAWQGLMHPDLTQLLGSYADEYRVALGQTPRKRGSRSLLVKTDNVVVKKWGHMRNLQGRAYAPSLVPPGVAVDEIR